MGQIARRLALMAAALAAAVLVSGCSGTDVELKGGVFDLMGVSGNMNARKSEPKLADRPGLVIPPSTSSLPPPSAAQQPVVAANGEAFPVNPEEAKKTKQAEIVARHAAFCEKARQRHEAGLTPVVESSPWGSCETSVLTNVTGRDIMGNKPIKTE